MNYYIIDNYFEDPITIRNLALQDKYYSKETHPHDVGGFPGMRSDYFNNTHKHLYELLKNSLLSVYKHMYTGKEKHGEFYIQTCFSYTDKNVVPNMHVDFDYGYNGYTKFYAGVVYLNPIVNSDYGTILNIKDDPILVENAFNRFVFYDADIPHMPNGTFGNDVNDSRLVCTCFLMLK